MKIKATTTGGPGTAFTCAHLTYQNPKYSGFQCNILRFFSLRGFLCDEKYETHMKQTHQHQKQQQQNGKIAHSLRVHGGLLIAIEISLFSQNKTQKNQPELL